jgi:hypothetical protein
MGHDPPPGTLTAPRCDEIRILAWGLTQGHPAESHPTHQDEQRGEARDPESKGGPGWRLAQVEQRQERNDEASEAGPEERKTAQAGWRKEELLNFDIVSQAAQITRDQLSRSRGVRRASLSGEREQLAS